MSVCSAEIFVRINTNKVYISYTTTRGEYKKHTCFEYELLDWFMRERATIALLVISKEVL